LISNDLFPDCADLAQLSLYCCSRLNQEAHSMRIHTSTQEMVKDLKEVKGVFANHDQPARKQYNRELEQQARLELALTLQMSLDVEWMLNKFLGHFRAYFLFDGFAYQCAQAGVQIESARQKGHSCSYQLQMEDMDLGKVEVYRGRKFVESELDAAGEPVVYSGVSAA